MCSSPAIVSPEGPSGTGETSPVPIGAGPATGRRRYLGQQISGRKLRSDCSGRDVRPKRGRHGALPMATPCPMLAEAEADTTPRRIETPGDFRCLAMTDCPQRQPGDSHFHVAWSAMAALCAHSPAICSSTPCGTSRCGSAQTPVRALHLTGARRVGAQVKSLAGACPDLEHSAQVESPYAGDECVASRIRDRIRRYSAWSPAGPVVEAFGARVLCAGDGVGAVPDAERVQREPSDLAPGGTAGLRRRDRTEKRLFCAQRQLMSTTGSLCLIW